jgi:signal peptidase I
MIVSSALMSWKTLMLITGSESPVVVVLSGSMEPTFFRGDILFLNRGNEPFRNGEIVVYNVDDKAIPVVHRIIQVHERQDSDYVDILTKVRLVFHLQACKPRPTAALVLGST